MAGTTQSNATSGIDIIFSFCKSQVLFTAVDIQLFEVLERKGPATAKVIAEECNTNPVSTQRLLDTCAALDLVIKNVGNGSSLYRNDAKTTAYFTTSSQTNLLGLIKFIRLSLFGTAKIQNEVREGQAGKPDNAVANEDWLQQVYKLKDGLNTFQNGMEGFMYMSIHHFDEIDLSMHSTIVDLGGGLGVHSRYIKTMYPNCDVILADKAEVIDEAKKEEANKKANIKFASVDFFKDNLPPADLYVLAHIIHDWLDDEALVILKHVYNALKLGGTILILDKLLDDNRTSPVIASIFDMVMLTVTHGKERTFEEFKELLSKSGFINTESHISVDDPVYDRIFALKPK